MRGHNIVLFAVAVLSVAFMIYALVAGAGTIVKAIEQPAAWLALARSLAAYAAAAIIMGLGWVLLLSAVKAGASPVMALAIFLLAQAAKYVPGNVAHLLGRVVLSQRAGIGSLEVATLLAIEVSAIAAGGTLAALYLVPDLLLSYAFLWKAAAVGGCLLILVVVLLFVLHVNLGKSAAVRRIRDAASRWLIITKDLMWHWRNVPFLLAYCLMVAAAFFMLGYFMQEVIKAIDPAIATRLNLVQVTAILAAAWLVGFVTPGAPAGIGVREAALVALLSPVTGNDIGLAAAALSRIMSVVGDAVVTLIGAALYCIARDPATTVKEP
jgi:uncharacterized membrane protein YbhN (UPF0104 family)